MSFESPTLITGAFDIDNTLREEGRDNDAAADAAIIVGNASRTLKAWAEGHIPPSRLYIATASYALGLIEGLLYFGLRA